MTSALVVTTCGRGGYLAKTVRSFEQACRHEFDVRVIVDDSGSDEYRDHLAGAYGDRFDIVSHGERRGLSAAIGSAWSAAAGADWVFHLEDDWLFPMPVDVEWMRLLCEDYELAQVALYRQPWSPAEVAVGGYVKLHGDQLTWQGDDSRLYTNDRVFSFNPCIYPGWVTELEPGEESVVTGQIDARFGVLADEAGGPRCFHIGNERSPGWSV